MQDRTVVSYATVPAAAVSELPPLSPKDRAYLMGEVKPPLKPREDMSDRILCQTVVVSWSIQFVHKTMGPGFRPLQMKDLARIRERPKHLRPVQVEAKVQPRAAFAECAGIAYRRVCEFFHTFGNDLKTKIIRA